MIQPELWMLTPFILFVSLRIPLMNAIDNKAQRKLNDQNENYIITHYGVEYYTPVTDIEGPAAHNSGYYTAEVIPVDVNTGEELKSVKNLFVPMHTGYSIGPNNNNNNPAYVNSIYLTEQDRVVELKPSPSTVVDEQLPAKKDDTKSKIPKKFKNKYTSTATLKKTSPNHVSDANPELLPESQTVFKKNRKRNVVTSTSSDDFLRLFYDNLRSLIQRQYLGYDY